jgi:hypothetical protein
MRAAEIAAELGGISHSGEWHRCRCPVCGSRTASLALKDGGRHGLIARCWRCGVSGDEIRTALRALGFTFALQGGFDNFAEQQRRQEHENRNLERAAEMWLAGLPGQDAVPDIYMHSRGIPLTEWPPSLRYLPAGHYFARHPSGTRDFPVMLAAVVDCRAEFTAVHRTWLTLSGDGKAPVDPLRMTLGRVAGGAVRLAMFEPDANQTLVIGEGIESSLSAGLLMQAPAWSALSAGNLGHLILPNEIRTVLIVVDNDSNGVGEAAARSAGLRWLAENRRVRLLIPKKRGCDANDLVKET